MLIEIRVFLPIGNRTFKKHKRKKQKTVGECALKPFLSLYLNLSVDFPYIDFYPVCLHFHGHFFEFTIIHTCGGVPTKCRLYPDKKVLYCHTKCIFKGNLTCRRGY